jgi:hypothetical protein
MEAVDTSTNPDLVLESVASGEVVDSDDAKAADSALQQQLIRDITSDDLNVLRQLGFSTVLKPHQKVLLIFETMSLRYLNLFLSFSPQDGVAFALKRAFREGVGTAIFDAMGLGKTVESLAIMCCLKRWRPNNG